MSATGAYNEANISGYTWMDNERSHLLRTWYTKFSYNVAGIRESRFNWLAQFSEASSIFFRQDPIHMVLMLNTFLHGPQNRSLQRDINTIPRTFSACGFFFR